MYAWESGLKGVTVYRAGCAREGILVTDEIKQAVEKNETALDRGYVVPAGDNVIGMKRTPSLKPPSLRSLSLRPLSLRSPNLKTAQLLPHNPHTC